MLFLIFESHPKKLYLIPNISISFIPVRTLTVFLKLYENTRITGNLNLRAISILKNCIIYDLICTKSNATVFTNDFFSKRRYMR